MEVVLLIVAVLCAASVAASPRIAAGAAPFSVNVRVTQGSTPFPQHVEPSLAVDDRGAVFLGWKEALTPDGPGQRVAFARSADGGATWSAGTIMALANASYYQSDPWLVLDRDGTVHYARIEYAGNLTYGGVTVTSSADGGRTWSAPVNADDRPGFADKDSMAGDGGSNLYVTYDDILSPTSDLVDLRLARSTDGGATWSPTVSVADTIGGILGPVLAPSANGTVYAAWWNTTDGNILADVSHDHAATWGTDVRVNPTVGSAWTPNTSWETPMPSIAVDGRGRVYVAWADRGTGDMDLLVSRSDDGGATWTSPVRVNDATTGDQWMPSLAVDPKGVVHAAWLDGRTGAWDAYYANSTDEGRTWSANVRVSTASFPLSFARPGDYLALAADANGTAYIAWTDGRLGSLNIYFARSTALVPAPEPPGFPWLLLLLILVPVAVVAVVAFVLLRRRRRVPPAP